MKHYRFQSAILALIMITGCAVDAGDETPEADPQTETTTQEVGTCNQYVQLGTVYFSTAAQTNWVGQCTITCAQWIRGSAEPFPGQGAACQGNTSTQYTAPYIGMCHGCRL